MSTTPDSLNDLRVRLRQFAAERDWEQFHVPKNLAMSVAIEAAEIMEHFQWLTPDESGALPEYCNGFGISFTAENFEQRLKEMMTSYSHWAGRMKDYPHTAERMCESYYRLFMDLLERREKILQRRKWWRRPDRIVRMLMPRRVERLLGLNT